MKWITRHWWQLVLGLTAVLHIAKLIQIDGYVISLLILALFPQLIEFVGSLEYENGILKIKIRDGKASLPNKEESLNPQPESKEKLFFPPLGPLPSEPSAQITFTPVSSLEMEVLAMMWHHQKEQFGPEAVSRWGFKPIGYRGGLVHLLCTQLEMRSLVKIDPNGLYYLSGAGLEFCKQRDSQLSDIGPGAIKFVPS